MSMSSSPSLFSDHGDDDDYVLEGEHVHYAVEGQDLADVDDHFRNDVKGEHDHDRDDVEGQHDHDPGDVEGDNIAQRVMARRRSSTHPGDVDSSVSSLEVVGVASPQSQANYLIDKLINFSRGLPQT